MECMPRGRWRRRGRDQSRASPASVRHSKPDADLLALFDMCQDAGAEGRLQHMRSQLRYACMCSEGSYFAQDAVWLLDVGDFLLELSGKKVAPWAMQCS